MGHRIHRRPSWNYCAYQLVSFAFISGSIVLYASYLCRSLIYYLTHVECFRFFDLAAIIAAPKLHTTTAVHATTISSSSSILRKISRIYRSYTCSRHQVLSSWLSTCFRHAFDVLSTRSRKSKARFAACYNNGMRPLSTVGVANCEKQSRNGRRRASSTPRRRSSQLFAQDDDEVFVTGSTLYVGEEVNPPPGHNPLGHNPRFLLP